jgi:hypothetical protein
MAYLKYGRLRATARGETLYSRWHSPDRRLYTHAETWAIGWDVYHQWWVYEPPLQPLPVQPLTAKDRSVLQNCLPF